MTKNEIIEYWPTATEEQHSVIWAYHAAGWSIGDVDDQGEILISRPYPNESLEHRKITSEGRVV